MSKKTPIMSSERPNGWNKQNWIKNVLSKSGTDIVEVKDEDKSKDIRNKMVYYPSLPLIMKSENKQQQLLCSPLGTDGQSFQTAMSLHPSVVGAQQQHQQQLQHQTISNNVMLTNQTSSSSSSLLPLSSSTLSTSSASLSAAPSATTLLISQNQSFLHNIKIELPQGPQSHHQIQLSQQQPQMHVQQQLAQQPHQHQQNGGSNSGSISSSRGAESSNQKAIYKCEQCNMTFGSKSAHTSHMKSHVKNENNFQMSAVASSRNASGQSATNQGTPTAGGSDPYQCNVCKKTFAVPARLIRHYRTHTGERPFECEFCHKMFSVKENLQVHRRIHTKERPYKCDVCGRAFEHSGKLHRHMRIHTGERPHKCSVCNKTFIQSGQLVIHMRTHTGEKPYKCPVEGCGKGFTCSKQLKVHSRTHTGEKPYHCDICFRDFGYNHVLKLHRVQHYGSKCYKCTICDETFKNKKEMEAHIKGHANEMPDDDDEAQQQQTGQSSPKPKQDQITNSRQVSTKSPIRQKSQQQPRYLRRESLPDSERSHDSSAASSTTGSIAMETPVDTSSETNSENEETVVNGTSLYDSSSMYQRLEQTTGIPFNLNTSRPTINPALLAAATIASRRVDAETNSAVNMSTMSPIGGDSEGSRISSQLVEEMDTNTSSEVLDYYQNSLGIVTTGGNPSLLSAARSSPMQIYEPMTMMKQNGYFAPAPVAEFRSSLHANDIVRRVEAAIAGAEPPLTPPPSSSTESPRSRSSSPESDSIIMADRDVMTLPLRKRKLYLNDNQTPDVPPVMRMNSVIQFAKAS